MRPSRSLAVGDTFGMWNRLRTCVRSMDRSALGRNEIVHERTPLIVNRPAPRNNHGECVKI